MRYAAAVLGLTVCLSGAFVSGRLSLAHMLAARLPKQSTSLPTLDLAVRLDPADANLRYARARTFTELSQFAAATPEFEAAAVRRPNDYMLWLWLGYARSKQQDGDGTLAAFRQAVQLAPFYAEPRWYLGDQLLRMDRRDEAFIEMRRAAASDPAMLPDVLDLAWIAYAGNSQQIEQALQPQTSDMRLGIARFLIAHGQVAAAAALCREQAKLSGADRYALVDDLLRTKQFPEAHEVWLGGRAAAGDSSAQADKADRIDDGGFERTREEISVIAPSFEWARTRNGHGVYAEPDASEPHGGALSLRLDWRGNAEPGTPAISQLALVEPGKRYRLSFAARARGIVTGGPVIVTVFDADNETGPALAQSAALPPSMDDWREFSVEFTAPATTRAVLLAVNRLPCSTTPCPIFGTSWFDDFSLQLI